MSDFNQRSFSGGINLVLDDTRIEPNQYREAFNVRSRFDTIAPIKDSVEDTNAPAGLKQGLLTFGSYLLLFVAGRAYYRDQSSDNWTQIPGFQMSATIPRFYTATVPASSFNFDRLLVSEDDITAIENPLTVIDRTIAGLVVQDGTNQPWLILPDATARVLQTYSQWSRSAREYVPIGKQMLYANDILFIVSPDGKTVYRSLTGRGLDFVVAINTSGDKISADEAIGGAPALSFGVGIEEITSIQALNTGQIFVSNRVSSKVVTVDKDNRYFGEPTFFYSSLIEVGCINQFSFLEILGDYAFIDIEGIRSFNAVLNLRNQGRNDVFSLAIAPIFANLLQDENRACTGAFDNYTFFSVKSIYGPVLCVLDTLNRKFVSFDQTVALDIIQMASTTPYARRFFGITTEKVFEFFASEEEDPYPLAIVRTGSWSTNDPSVMQKSLFVRTVFADVPIDDFAYVTLIADGRRVSTVGKPLKTSESGVLLPAEFPVYFDEAKNINPLVFNFMDGAQAWKLGVFVRWSNGAVLTHIALTGSSVTSTQSVGEQAKYG